MKTCIRIFGLLLLLLHSTILWAAPCDADIDGDVDFDDIALIMSTRGQAATGPDDPMDGFPDGLINNRDVLVCRRQCTLPGCSSPPSNTPPVADAGADSSAQLNQLVMLDGSASFDSDGDGLEYQWSVINLPENSNAALSDNSASKPSFVLDVQGRYEFQLLVYDGTEFSAPDSVVVDTANTPPVADAGPDQTPLVDTLANLDGTGSSDVNGDPLTYFWQLESRPQDSSSELNNTNVAQPELLIDSAGTYQLSLVVNDGLVDSEADRVLLNTANSKPVADAGENLSASVNQVVQLDGSASTDIDGDTLSYLWSTLSKPLLSTSELDDANAVMPSFVIDEPGDYIFQLIVNDGNLDSDADTVNISFINTPPVADAGLPQTVDLGDRVSLDGSLSRDDDNDPITFDWALVSAPENSLAIIESPDPMSPFASFVADMAGSYTAQLIVSDGFEDSAPATVAISTSNSRPVADAGEDQMPDVGSVLNLNGQNSFDPDGDPLQFVWSVISAPIGSLAQPSPANTEASELTVDQPGTYVVQLIVNDGVLDSEPDTATLITKNREPIADAGTNLTGLVGELVNLDGNGSSDPDGDPLSFAWQITSAPDQSTSTLAGEDTPNPAFTPDVAGSYQFSLVVNDGELSSTADSVELIATEPQRILDLQLDSSIIGVARDVHGIVRLGEPAPAGGVIVSLLSSQPGIAAISPLSVDIAEGEREAAIIASGLQVGAAQLSASADGYNTDTEVVEVTDFLISIDDPGELVPDQVASLAVSLSKPAPSGGVLISLVSSDQALLTTEASVFIEEGLQIATTNPQITAQNLGVATVTATAAGFAPDSRPISISLEMGLSPNNFRVVESRTEALTLTLSGPAPAAGLPVALLSQDPTIATVPGQVVVPAGELSVDVPVTGVAVGNTQISASTAGVDTVEHPVEVVPLPPINIGDLAIGQNLQVSQRGSLGLAAPAGNTMITLTSAEPDKLLLSNRRDQAGQASIVLQVNAGQTQIPTFYAQALTGVGISNFTATAPGYADADITVDFDRSGFYINSNDFTTTTFSNNTSVRIRSARVNDAGGFAQNQDVRAGFSTSVSVTSSDESVGTITSPLVFEAIDSLLSSFDPAAAGVTTLSIQQPLGFIDIDNTRTAIEATVEAPGISASNTDVGFSLQRRQTLNLQQSPPTPTNVLLQVANPAIVRVSADPLVLGSADGRLVLPNVSSSNAQFYYVQGMARGQTSLTISAPGFQSRLVEVNILGSGFYIETRSYETTTFSNDTAIRIRSASLRPNGDFLEQQSVRAGASFSVPMSSSNPAVGTVTSPVNFETNQNAVNATFDPLNAGVTAISLSQPGPEYATPANLRDSIEVTVTAPDINFANALTGFNLQEQVRASLQQAPPTPTDVTFTLADPSIALISVDPSAQGTGSIIRQGVTSTELGTFYLQGLRQGTTTITVSAPGYATRVADIEVLASGVTFNSVPVNTTTFSPERSVRLRTVVLDPVSKAFRANRALRGGISIEVPISSSAPGVGTIASPIIIVGGSSSGSVLFDPLTAGSTELSITQPSGFDEFNNVPQTQTATVDAPDIFVSDVAVGENLQESQVVRLEVAPPSPVDVVITVLAPGVSLLSKDATLQGNNTLVFSGVTTTTVGTIHVQGMSRGVTTFEAKAAGYNDDIAEVSVVPSGFAINQNNFTIDSNAANRNLLIRAGRLNPTTLNFAELQQVRGGLSVNVNVESSDPGVGVITTSPVLFSGGISQVATAFDPLSAGQTRLRVLRPLSPSSFEVPSNFSDIEVTVTP